MVVSPVAAADTIAFDFPARFLRKGANKLVLTAVDGPSTGDSQVHSVITYDALELDQDSSRKYLSTVVAAEVVPTIFYMRHGDEVVELVDVYVRHNATVRRGEVSSDRRDRQIC